MRDGVVHGSLTSQDAYQAQKLDRAGPEFVLASGPPEMATAPSCWWQRRKESMNFSSAVGIPNDERECLCS